MNSASWPSTHGVVCAGMQQLDILDPAFQGRIPEQAPPPLQQGREAGLPCAPEQGDGSLAAMFPYLWMACRPADTSVTRPPLISLSTEAMPLEGQPVATPDRSMLCAAHVTCSGASLGTWAWLTAASTVNGKAGCSACACACRVSGQQHQPAAPAPDGQLVPVR